MTLRTTHLFDPSERPWNLGSDLMRADYPDHGTASEAVRQVVTCPDHDFTATGTGPPSWVTGRGLLVVAGTSDTRIGFGVRAGLALTSPLMAAVAEVNRCDPVGHVWLSDGEDDHSWTLIWGTTLPHRWTHAIDLQRAIFFCVTDHHTYLCDLVSHFAPFGGLAYWPAQSGRHQSVVSGRHLLEELT